MPVTQESVVAMLLSYAGLLYVIENAIKAAVRWWKAHEIRK